MNEFEHWENEIKRGKDYRKTYGAEAKWKEYRDYYRHNFPEELKYNLVYSSIAAEAPAVLYSFPHISVSPIRSGYEPFAYVLEAIDNRLVKQQNLGEECEDILVDIPTCGIGCMVMGYDSQFGYSLKTGETSTRFGSHSEKIEYESTIKKGMPWALRCMPEDFVVPWGTNRFSGAPWVAFRSVRALQDAKEEKKYSAKGKAELNASMTTNTEGKYPDELSPVFIWQIHDLRSGNLFVFAEGGTQFLRKEADTLQTSLGLPAETIQFIKDPQWMWGIPEVRYYEGFQKEINEIISQRSAFRKVGLLRFLYLKGVIEEGEMKKMMGPEPVVGIEIEKSLGTNVNDLIQTFQPAIPHDLTPVKADLREDVRELTGKSKMYMGENAPRSHTTKFEVQTVTDNASGRDRKKREKMGRFIERIIAKENELIFRHWTDKQVEYVVGPDLVGYWVEFKGTQLKSEYLVNVAVDDMTPVTRETKLAEAQALLQMMGQDPMFQQMYPEAGMQVRKMILTQFSWLNFSQFQPREGVGGSEEKPMGMEQFAGAFPEMRKKGNAQMQMQ